jgi:large subunit ribosomal protein L44
MNISYTISSAHGSSGGRARKPSPEGNSGPPFSFLLVHVGLWVVMQRRLASTAASAVKRATHVHNSKPALSTAHLGAFPPAQARDPFFDAEAWAQVQPAPPSALSAFANRVGLGKALGTTPEKVLAACTHPSFVPLWQKLHPKETKVPETNANLASLGNSLLGMFASEYLHTAYPHLPTRVLKAAVSAYVGPTTCASIAKEMGAAQLLRWNRAVSIYTLCLRFFFINLSTLAF